MTQRALKEHSESHQRAREQSDFVIPSKPKILCVILFNASLRNTALLLAHLLYMTYLIGK